jgi:MFS family permease
LIIGGSIVESFGWQTTFLFMTPIAIILFAVITKFVRVKEIDQQQLVSNKASEFCSRFTHVRKDILLTENIKNANTYTRGINKSHNDFENKQKINKSIDIKGAITLSITVISFLLILQFLEKVGSNNLVQIMLFSVVSIVSLFLFIVVEKKAQFPLIDFKLLKNKTILSANIITMTVGLTTLMVVYQSLIRSPPPLGFGGDASSIASVHCHI